MGQQQHKYLPPSLSLVNDQVEADRRHQHLPKSFILPALLLLECVQILIPFASRDSRALLSCQCKPWNLQKPIFVPCLHFSDVDYYYLFFNDYFVAINWHPQAVLSVTPIQWNTHWNFRFFG